MTSHPHKLLGASNISVHKNIEITHICCDNTQKSNKPRPSHLALNMRGFNSATTKPCNQVIYIIYNRVYHINTFDAKLVTDEITTSRQNDIIQHWFLWSSCHYYSQRKPTKTIQQCVHYTLCMVPKTKDAPCRSYIEMLTHLPTRLKNGVEGGGGRGVFRSTFEALVTRRGHTSPWWDSWRPPRDSISRLQARNHIPAQKWCEKTWSYASMLSYASVSCNLTMNFVGS